MSYEDFLKLNSKYRLSAEWDNTLKEVNKDSAFIIADNYKAQIWWYNDTTFKVLYYGIEKYKKLLDDLGVEYTWTSDRKNGGLEHEYVIDFKYFDKVIEIFNPKKSPSKKVNPFSVRNQNIYLRFMRNIDYDFYNNLLEKNIKGIDLSLENKKSKKPKK